jgi:hypothetical protein
MIRGSGFSNNWAIATGLGGFAASGAVATVGSNPGATDTSIGTSSSIRNEAIAFAGGDGVATMSGAFGGAINASGANAFVDVNRSSFIGNQAIAAMPSSSSTGNAQAGIAVGGAIEHDTGASVSVAKSLIKGNLARGAGADRTAREAPHSAGESGVSMGMS